MSTYSNAQTRDTHRMTVPLDTCFKTVQVRLDAFLAPDRLGAVDEGIRTWLDEYLMKYVKICSICMLCYTCI